MIKTEILADGRTHTWSDQRMKIMQETGIIYDDAVDTVPHTYAETDIPVDIPAEATSEYYERELRRLGVDV